jgi:hypothetical protein
VGDSPAPARAAASRTGRTCGISVLAWPAPKGVRVRSRFAETGRGKRARHRRAARHPIFFRTKPYYDIFCCDVNADGYFDLVTADTESPCTMHIFAADVNADGYCDLVTANSGDNLSRTSSWTSMLKLVIFLTSWRTARQQNIGKMGSGIDLVQT